MTRQHVLSLLWCTLVLGHLDVASAATGTITGQLTHPMAQTAINDVVVWAEPVGELPTFPPPAQPAEMAQVQLAFTPRVLPVLVGTTVNFPNRDTVYHSVFSFARQQRFEIGLYPPGESRAVTFDTPGLVKVFCNIHDQMFGAILVLPTPYFSTSTPEGTFRLANVPAGTYTVQVWHARLQGAPHTVTVTAGGTATLALVLQPGAARSNAPSQQRSSGRALEPALQNLCLDGEYGARVPRRNLTRRRLASTAQCVAAHRGGPALYAPAVCRPPAAP